MSQSLVQKRSIEERMLALSKQNQDFIKRFLEYLCYDWNPNTQAGTVVRYSNALVILAEETHKDFDQITRDDVLTFLNKRKKPESDDPKHQWIGAYNTYLGWFKHFFRWLHNRGRIRDDWQTPECVKIRFVRRKETSIYSPLDIWTQEDDLLYIKYCDKRRDKALHALFRDTGSRPFEIGRIKLRDVMFHDRYAELVLNGKNGQRVLALVFSFPYIRDWLEDHHIKDPDAPLFPKENHGYGGLTRQGIYFIYRRNWKRFKKLAEDPRVSEADRVHINALLAKPWNPYVRRHSALTEHAKILPEQVLKKHADWSPNSKQAKRYVHLSGGESKSIMLQYYGIKLRNKEMALKPRICPRCKHNNVPEAEYCKQCAFALTQNAYASLKQKEQDVLTRLRRLEEENERLRKEIDLRAK